MKGCLGVQRRLWSEIAGVVLLCLAVPAALGAPITYVFSGPATGTLNGTPFTGAQVTVSATADTDNVTSAGPSLPCVVPSKITVDIAGLGTVTATGSSYVFDNQISSVWGFGEGNCSGGSDWLDVSDAQASTYALVSNLAPTTGTQFGGGTADTTSGKLVFTAVPLTFQATLGQAPTISTIPTLSRWALLLLGLMLTATAVFFLRRKAKTYG
jgi:hypothetical protein